MLTKKGNEQKAAGRTSVKTAFQEKVFQPVVNILKTGVEPTALAVAVSLGIVVGIIPLLGTTTIICTMLAYSFRLNLPALQLANYLMFPVQLLLFIPFFQAGGYFFEPSGLPASVSQISEMISHDLWGTIQLFWLANLQALLVWFLTGIPAFLMLNFILRRSFLKLFPALSASKSKDR